MDGYFKPNFKNERKELHTLELDDCDFIPDDETFLYPAFKRKYYCPRCRTITNISGGNPYCWDCNWDSLTDLTHEKNKCVA